MDNDSLGLGVTRAAGMSHCEGLLCPDRLCWLALLELDEL